MNLLNQNPKVRRHMVMLVIILLMMLPCAGFGMLLLVAAFSSDAPPDGLVRGIAVIGLLGIPGILLAVGFMILARLRSGFTISTRRRLFGFYVFLLAYCGFWLAGLGIGEKPKSNSGDLLLLLMVSLVIAIPAFVTMFTKPESDPIDGSKTQEDSLSLH